MNRNVSLDILKLSMAFMVVGMHASFLQNISALFEYLFVNGFFRIAVPIFLVINGFYFFPVLSKTKQLTWIKRVLILYLVWMFFYSYFWLVIPDFSFASIIYLLQNIIIGYKHLWYISGMLGAAFILLLFRSFSSKFLSCTILILFAIGVIIQYLGNYHYFEGSVLDEFFNKDWIHRNAIFFSYPFFCIGYLINKHKIHEKITLRNTLFMSILGMSCLLFESWFNFHQESREGGFDNYVFLLLACPATFLLFLKLNISGNSKNIALYSSAIYFIHLFLLIVLKKFTELEGTLLTISCIITSAIASYFIIEINKRVKFIL